jgi:DNA-binding transcriptional MerR regulator
MATYRMREIIERTNFSPRTVRHYTALGLIPKPVLAGALTRYPRDTLGKLVAIKHWHQVQKLSAVAIKRAIRETPDAQWEAWARKTDPPPPVAPVPVATVAPARTASAGVGADGAQGETWHHVPLMPGLMLLMREGAGELTANVAREIQKRYRAG